MQYKNKQTGVIVEPKTDIAAQTFERSKVWIPLEGGGIRKTIDQMKVSELEAYAADNGIDISEAQSKAAMLEAIKAAQAKGGATQ